MKAQMKKVLVVLTAIVMMGLGAKSVAAATEVPITKVTFPTAITVYTGETKTLTVGANPTNTTYKTAITWKVDDQGFFTSKVNGTGTKANQASSISITGKKACTTGTVKASIKVYDSTGKYIKTYAGTCKVTVKAAVALKSISLSKTSATVNVGSSLTLGVNYNPTNTTVAKNVTWTSSNTKVATVAGGKVVAKAPGTVTVTAKVGGKSATCKVTVKAPITSVKLSKTSATINVGSNLGLSVTYSPANTTDSKTITWTSSNTAVATVSKGTITGKKAGTATITAKMGSKTATCKITVKAVAPSFVNVGDCYTRINNYRKSAGLKALVKDTKLESIAQTRAKEIVSKFSHTRPNGQSGLTLISGNIYKGENIAKGQTSCAAVMTAWYNSAGHKANMLNSHFTKVGFAGYKYNGNFYWVTMFSS